MGTRNLIAVKKDGEYKIGQYGQWDGYPEGQGVGCLEFLSEEGNQDALKNALSKVRFIDKDGKDKEFMDSYEANAPEWSSDPDNRTDEQKHWFRNYVSRDLGSKILGNVSGSMDDEVLLINQVKFAGDSLSCEWAYVIDFDLNTFECFRGFNEEEVTEGRFLSSDESLEKSDGYHPVVLIKKYMLDSLPTEEQFLADLEGKED